MRRIVLPDAFFALDGVFETLLSVLDDFGAYPAVIEAELQRYLPFLATTKVLMAAVRAGVGREEAHEVIKEHAVAAALAMRESGRADQRPGRPAGGRSPARALGRRSRPGAGRPALVHGDRPSTRSAAFVAQVGGLVAPLPRRRHLRLGRDHL